MDDIDDDPPGEDDALTLPPASSRAPVSEDLYRQAIEERQRAEEEANHLRQLLAASGVSIPGFSTPIPPPGPVGVFPPTTKDRNLATAHGLQMTLNHNALDHSHIPSPLITSTHLHNQPQPQLQTRSLDPQGTIFTDTNNISFPPLFSFIPPKSANTGINNEGSSRRISNNSHSRFPKWLQQTLLRPFFWLTSASQANAAVPVATAASISSPASSNEEPIDLAASPVIRAGHKRRLTQTHAESPDFTEKLAFYRRRRTRKTACSVRARAFYDPNTRKKAVVYDLRWEIMVNARFCGPISAKYAEAGKEYFIDYAECVFPRYKICLVIALHVIAAQELEMVACMEEYRSATKEIDLYRPFYYMANRVLEVASWVEVYMYADLDNLPPIPPPSDDLISDFFIRFPDTKYPSTYGRLHAPKSRSFGHGTAVTRPQDGLLDLVILNTDTKDLTGCPEKRSPDFVAVLRSFTSYRRFDADVRDVLAMIEFKLDHVKHARAPDLHPANSEEPLVSTYESIIPLGSSSDHTGREQVIEYNALTQTAQSPFRRSAIGLLINHMRIQIITNDRGGCIISEECNFEDDFAVLLGVVIALKDSATDLTGQEPGVTPVDRADKFSPVPPSEFELKEVEIQTRTTVATGRRVQPFKVNVELSARPGELSAVYAFGPDLCAKPLPISGAAARDRWSRQLPMQRELGTETREAKQHAVVAIREFNALLSLVQPPKQYSPSAIFGHSTVRFQAKSQHQQSTGILQLSWVSGLYTSEAKVIKRANELGIKVVPELIGSLDLAELDKGLIRTKLTVAFPKQMRPTNMVLRALSFKTTFAPLHSVVEVTKLLCAIEHILRGHLALYRAGILHSNINETNLVVNSEAHEEGLLIGFEYAQLSDSQIAGFQEAVSINNLSSSPSSSAISEPASDQDQQGCIEICDQIAFLPIPLCKEIPQVRTYSHDLEAIAWCVFYLICSYRRGWRIDNANIRCWYSGNWDSITDSKQGFIDRGAQDPTFVDPFTEALGVSAAPLRLCMRQWCRHLGGGGELDVNAMLGSLLVARKAYEKEYH